MATVIRAERPQDRAAVRTLNEWAFPTPAEADLHRFRVGVTLERFRMAKTLTADGQRPDESAP
ncbi:MAG: hypothetical protein R3310_00260 [Candidatus Competibacteraceae bacterium]|nr:hypothetical protein [Candidatus Competibacteraceae bacterium]